MTRAAQLAGLGSLEGSAPAYACRAWVNFNGQGTIAIRASGNVSSITDDGTGMYGINLATSMPDSNYSFIGYARRENDAVGYGALVTSQLNQAKSTSAFRIMTVYAQGAGAYDYTEINVAVFR